MNDIVSVYLATWNETDPAARRKLLAEHWAEDVSYVDPMMVATGRDQLEAAIAGVQQQFPGFVFSGHGPADGHHNQVRFGWALGPDGVEAPVLGFDVLTTDDSGRIASALGFLDKIPA